MPVYTFSEDDFCLPSLLHLWNKTVSKEEIIDDLTIFIFVIFIILALFGVFFCPFFFFSLCFSKLTSTKKQGWSFDFWNPFVMARLHWIFKFDEFRQSHFNSCHLDCPIVVICDQRKELIREDCNLLAENWEELSLSPGYPKARIHF